MTMAGPEILGIPASQGAVMMLAWAAHTLAMTTTALALGLGAFIGVLHINHNSMKFLAGLRGTIKRLFLPCATLALACIFMSLMATTITGGQLFFSNGSNWLMDSATLMTKLVMARIIFFACAALAATSIFIALENVRRSGEERVTIFALRLLCGAAVVGLLARIIDLVILCTNHPTIPQPGFAAIITIGIVITALIVGTAILGILRPRNALWSIAAASATFIGIAASSRIDLTLADAAHLATSPTFDAATRPQPVLMALFLIFTACACIALGLMLQWWRKDVKSEV